MSDKPIAELVSDVERLTARAVECARTEAAASRETTQARNELNAAQKQLDDAMAKLRSSAPWNTDWHSRANPGMPG